MALQISRCNGFQPFTLAKVSKRLGSFTKAKTPINEPAIQYEKSTDYNTWESRKPDIETACLSSVMSVNYMYFVGSLFIISCRCSRYNKASKLNTYLPATNDNVKTKDKDHHHSIICIYKRLFKNDQIICIWLLLLYL